MDEPLQLLVPADENEAKLARYGRYAGLPFAAVLRIGEVITGIRFEIRYVQKEGGDVEFERQLGPEFDRLTEQGDINVSINPASATLTVYEIRDGLDDAKAWALFEAFAQRLAEFGFSAGEECHYCREGHGGRVVFQGGRVGQICQPCLEARAQRLLKLQTLGRHSIAEAVKSVLLASVVVAIGWLAFWSCLDAYLRWSGPIGVPREVLLFFPILLGAGFGALALRCGRKVMIENRRVIGALAAGSVVLGVLAGELCSTLWFIFREFHVINFRAALIAYPQILKVTDGTYVALKALALGSAVVSPFLVRVTRKATLGL